MYKCETSLELPRLKFLLSCKIVRSGVLFKFPIAKFACKYLHKWGLVETQLSCTVPTANSSGVTGKGCGSTFKPCYDLLSHIISNPIPQVF